MISLNDVTIRFGGFELFKAVTFIISPKERIGLVGKNGAGKSTLLKVILGLQKPDEGIVALPSDISIGYLPQQMVHHDNTSLLNETGKAFEELNKIEKKISQLNEKISNRDDYHSEDYMKLLQKLSDLSERQHLIGGEKRDEIIERTLLGLGFERSDFTRGTHEFSGGWRMRIELAKLLIRNPDVLLLDEPTNHLDIESIQWLEDYLKTYPGSLVLISHDRAFLDNVTVRTVELSLGKMYDYKVPYSKYVNLRKERHEQQLAAFKNQQKMIGDTEKFIDQFRYKATKAVQVQSRIKQLDKIERIEVDEEDLSSLNIKFPSAPRSGSIVIETIEVSKTYGTKTVLDKVDLIVERGEKIAFVGRNGEGKTTLSKIIMNHISHTGTLKIGHNVRIGYFAQNQDEIMNENKTVLQFLDEVAVGDIRTKLRDLLGAFLFRGEDVDKKVKVLSGGERSRLALAKLLLEPYNLLVLDEPTNHLDMRSKDILKQALQKYNGTLILVSHDREFLDGLVHKIYEFRNHKIKQFIGGIYDFLKKKKLESLQQLNTNTQTLKRPIGEELNEISENKTTFIEKKDLEKKIRKIENQILTIEKEIHHLENEISIIDTIMADPDKAKDKINDKTFFSGYNDLKAKLDYRLMLWESLHHELQEAKENKN